MLVRYENCVAGHLLHVCHFWACEWFIFPLTRFTAVRLWHCNVNTVTQYIFVHLGHQYINNKINTCLMKPFIGHVELVLFRIVLVQDCVNPPDHTYVPIQYVMGHPSQIPPTISAPPMFLFLLHKWNTIHWMAIIKSSLFTNPPPPFNYIAPHLVTMLCAHSFWDPQIPMTQFSGLSHIHFLVCGFPCIFYINMVNKAVLFMFYWAAWWWTINMADTGKMESLFLYSVHLYLLKYMKQGHALWD